MTLATEVEALEIEARLATVQRELEAEAAAAVARKAEAAKLAAAGDWEAARAAYSALLEAAWQEDAEPDPALLANRAACALRLGQLDACVADCDAALGDDDADGGGDGDGDGDGEHSCTLPLCSGGRWHPGVRSRHCRSSSSCGYMRSGSCPIRRPARYRERKAAYRHTGGVEV